MNARPGRVGAFLDARALPIYVGFGNMPMRAPKDTARVAIEAIHAASRTARAAACARLAFPAAEPFFGATRANPMGLASRHGYRWIRGRISDYWEEVLTLSR
jgi:hypothetical protein